ncbi:MAG: acyloxyacyl hydrolase, partial [Pelagibacteraceae bacterium]
MHSKIKNVIFAVFFSIFFLVSFNSISAEKDQDHQINFFTGNVDFSDDKQSAILIGFLHQNENFNRDTCLG